MVHWFWIVIVLFVGVAIGFGLAACLAANKIKENYECYQHGFQEGHTVGYRDGLAEWQKVG